MRNPNNLPKVLLSEGSSLSSRQTLTILGLSGYYVGICDPNPMCISRFSSFTKRYHRCPPFNDQPLEYVRFLADTARRDGYQVLIPVHEQAFLLAKYRHLIPAAMALAEFPAFQRVQGKSDFALVLQELALPQPAFQILENPNLIRDYSEFPYYLKANFGTAGQGVWRIGSASQRDQTIKKIISEDMARKNKLIIQQQIDGYLCQVQAFFNQGQLWAAHCTQTRGTSIGGGHAARTSVNHPVVIQHVQVLGYSLGWNGPIALDYIYDEAAAQPYFIEANPRLVEPMNAYLSGINFPDLTVQAALGINKIGDRPLLGKPGVRSHSLMANLLGLSTEGSSRRDLIQAIMQSIKKQGVFKDSREDLTPFATDLVSAIPFLVVLTQLLLNPRRAGTIGKYSVDTYSLRASTVASLEKNTYLL